MPTLLSVRSLSKSFGALHVTRDVTFDVDEGEILGIIGPNGAGKTTLFSLLAGNLDAFRRIDPLQGTGHHRAAGRSPGRDWDWGGLTRCPVPSPT